jgi:hypothetical protein
MSRDGTFYGDFVGVVQDHGLSQLNDGRPYLWMNILSISRNDKQGSQEGVNCLYTTWLWLNSEKAIDATIEQLNRAFGLEADINSLDMLNAGTIRGKQCDLSVEEVIVQKTGAKKLQGKWLNPPNSYSARRNSHSSKTDMAAIKAFIAKATQTNGAEGVPGDETGRGDDDLPY